MKIGIMVLSNTGNTLLVAQRIKDALSAEGHMASIERVTAMNENPNTKAGQQLNAAPRTESYDVLIFGAPVWAVSLASVMKAYLSRLPSLQGKKVSCFVTQAFPYAWMGGNRAIRQMRGICEAKGAQVLETGVVNWSNKQRESRIAGLVKKLTRVSALFEK